MSNRERRPFPSRENEDTWTIKHVQKSAPGAEYREWYRGAFLDAAERLQRRKALLSPRQGFYIAVSPQFASWGAPPPWYIDPLMRFERQQYYVGLLKAAEPMRAVLLARGGAVWTELDRREARDPDFAPEPQERDERWRVIVRRAPELDE
ncbi:hypothetical protein [Mesorhizobium mediterraneum]|uniref:hypothetical protein n=1 Tax=Mesorhizobium mediterraneum TaxID=43617 RepID=UPI001FEF60ED|nr:hypothetical protein [Mesorhizobium mediterraneum]